MEESQRRNPLIVALDLDDRTEILAMARRLAGEVGMVKIGLQAYVAHGPDLVRELRAQGHSIFLDLKLHDIPNTVASAMRQIAELGVTFTTVHASGGSEMLRAAVAAASDTRILAVTVLTSIDAAALDAIGHRDDVRSSVLRLASLATGAGVDGVVASPQEVGEIRRVAGDLEIVTPGIRPAGADRGDQKRVMTPREAIEAGADWLVIGRPITRADDPLLATRQILRSLE